MLNIIFSNYGYCLKEFFSVTKMILYIMCQFMEVEMRDGKILTLIVGFGETGNTLVDVLKDEPFESEKKFFLQSRLPGNRKNR